MTIVLKDRVTTDNTTFQKLVLRMPVLISVLGRPPLSLRYTNLGPMECDSHAASCKHCHSVGHEERHCIRTYASKTRGPRHVFEHSAQLMDPEEIENTANGPAPSPSGGEPATGTTTSVTVVPEIPANDPDAANSVTSGFHHRRWTRLQRTPSPIRPLSLNPQPALGTTTTGKRQRSRREKQGRESPMAPILRRSSQRKKRPDFPRLQPAKPGAGHTK